MEPMVDLVVSAAIGGMASQFMETVCGAGTHWLGEFLRDHRPNAVKRAQQSTNQFLDELAKRVTALEQRSVLSEQQLARSQDHPDFTVMLQKAMLTAAQTEDIRKHILLARLVSERLAVTPDSMYACVSKLACDTIAYINSNQLHLLGLLSCLFYIRPNDLPAEETLFRRAVSAWVVHQITPYVTLTYYHHDLMHLQSLSCVDYNTIAGRDLHGFVIASKASPNCTLSFAEVLKDTPLWDSLSKLWNRGLQHTTLTTVGLLMGALTHDSVTGQTTLFTEWF